ncbi:MAG: class I SAM-dependent methyltransferase [Sphingobacteriales bacterium]|nr:MAG: class I SAM-dependent methyltransferase [Sphingobacteriales bacterium]
MRKFIESLNFKFLYLKKSFGHKPFHLLDIGAGNHSASKTCRVFPACAYYGVDISKDYNNDESDFRAMKSFYELDLTKLDYSVIPDNYFDAIWMVHVIEHLVNGDEVITALLPKLKSGGFIFIEYPGIKSTRLPSMPGTLNFYDDATHVRIYSVKELSSLLVKNNFTVIKGGTRRNWYHIVLLPLRIFQSLYTYKKLVGSVFWDLLGFAEFIYAQKN